MRMRDFQDWLESEIRRGEEYVKSHPFAGDREEIRVRTETLREVQMVAESTPEKEAEEDAVSVEGAGEKIPGAASAGENQPGDIRPVEEGDEDASQPVAGEG